MKTSIDALEFLRELKERRTETIEQYKKDIEEQGKIWKEYAVSTDRAIRDNVDFRGIAALHPETLVNLFTEAYDARMRMLKDKARAGLESLKEEIKELEGELYSSDD